MATDVPRSMVAMNLKLYQRRPQIYYTQRRPQTRTRFGSWCWNFEVLELGLGFGVWKLGHGIWIVWSWDFGQLGFGFLKVGHLEFETWNLEV